MKRKYKRFLRELQADQARVVDAYGQLASRLAKIEDQVEGMRWRMDEVTPQFPPCDERGLRAAIRDNLK
jgi:hypothetical protein